MTVNYPDILRMFLARFFQPGSSSHMGAPCRIDLSARSFLGEEPSEAWFIMDTGGPFGIMDEDKRMLFGVLGLGPEYEGICRHLKQLKEKCCNIAMFLIQ